MKIVLTVAALCCGLTLHAQTPIRVSGSTTVKGVLEPKQAWLESAIGRQIEFAGTGTNAGLVGLVSGSTDIAMISTPLEEAARVINQKTPGRVDPTKLSAEHIGDVRVVFIVNPHNPVRALNAQQLADVLTGKVTNWKEVGGSDQPILVVSLGNGGPLLQDQLLHGQSITSTAKVVPNATQIPVAVSQDAAAIGIISSTHGRGQTSLVHTDANIVAPLFLVTRGPANAEAQRLVEAARKLFSQISSG